MDVLVVGRIALMYQTKDKKHMGAWNQLECEWQSLDSGDYKDAILKGIRMAKKQASTEMLELPILVPVEAQ